MLNFEEIVIKLFPTSFDFVGVQVVLFFATMQLVSYGNSGNKTLAELRYSKWVEKSKSNTMTSVKDLEKFPPTVEAARLNIKRAHYQASIWTNLSLDIVPLDVKQFGWVKDSTNVQ